MSPRRGFVEGVSETIRRRKMLKGGERVLVAVSGGPDSLALLYALAELGVDLHVAHFDHRMREGSGADAAYVERIARKLGLPATIGSAPPGRPPAGLSPEEAARERRLNFLEDVGGATGAVRIATGHTLDDQAETVLMRLLTGTGARGLGGIPPVRDPYIRPLIDRRRLEVEAYCRLLRLRPRRDPTNSEPRFLRNVIRHEVLPLLVERINGRLPESLARTADLLRDEDALLDSLASEAIEIDGSSSAAGLDVSRLLSLQLPLRRRVLRLAAGLPALNASKVEAILQLAEHGRSGDGIDLGQRLNARLEYGSLLIGRSTSPATVPSPVRLDVPGRTEVPWAEGVVTVWEEHMAPATVPDGRTVCVLDGGKLGDLVVRARRRGDRIMPLGMKGTKSVADLLAEDKVPRSRRDSVPIVTSSGEVLWVIGHRMSERFKVNASTTRFMWMAFEEGGAWS